MFKLEMFNLLIKFAKDSQNIDVTYEELLLLPYWRCVWGWWMAKAYYQIDYHYKRLEDVPEGTENYSIVGDVYTSYRMERGQIESQSITMDECRKYYGD